MYKKKKNSNSDRKWIQKNKINSAKTWDNIKNSLNRIKKKRLQRIYIIIVVALYHVTAGKGQMLIINGVYWPLRNFIRYTFNNFLFNNLIKYMIY